MPKPISKINNMGNWITDLVIRSLIKLALNLPLKLRLWFVGTLLKKLVAPIAGYRKRAISNLKYIYPEMTRTERSRIADAVADNAGRTFIENYDILGLRDRMKNVPIEGSGFAAIAKAREENKPVLFVTGHLGNFEAPRAALVALGFKVGGLYRPMANPFFNKHYAENMHKLSGPVFEQSRSGTIGLMRHIKSGGMAVLLFDIYHSKGDPIPFLGKPAPTLTSAAEIALKTNALLIPFFGLRQKDGQTFRIIFQDPLEHSTAYKMTVEMTRRLEELVLENIDQWFWIHRRWKPERHRRKKNSSNPS